METSDAVEIFSALGHAARLSVVRALLKAGPDGIAAGDLSEAIDVPPSTLSHHLSTIEATGLIRARRDGRHIRYNVDAGAMQALISFLVDDCCGTRPELCGFANKKADRQCTV